MAAQTGNLDRAEGWVAAEKLASIVSQLKTARLDWRRQHGRNREVGGRELPSREELKTLVEAIRAALFPMRLGPLDIREESEDYFVGHTLGLALTALARQVRLELALAVGKKGLPADGDIEGRVSGIVRDFGEALPGIRRILDSDVLAAYRGDPAAGSVDEVLICYPGIRAVILYRLAHQLYVLGVPLVARIISEIAHSETGIDIHPGARIGGGFFVDHGTGVVIGETTVIGERVRLYQAVTLGSKGFRDGHSGELPKGYPRHPIVEDDVVIYAGATVLGRITIGKCSTIGGNVWLTRSVPPGSHITQAYASERPLTDGAGI